MFAAQNRYSSISFACALSALAAVSAAKAAKLPKPHIYFLGEDITGKTTQVLIGEQIALTTSPPPVQGQTQAWAVAGNMSPIGGFDYSGKCPTSPNMSSTPCDVIAPVDKKDPATTFYLVAPGTYSVAYVYSVNGETANASATLVAKGPSNVVLKAAESIAQIYQHGTNYFLSIGNVYDQIPGIDITISAKDTNGGKFVWGQIITSSREGYIQDGNVTICSGLSGLDNVFPYNDTSGTDEVTDVPRIIITGDSYAYDTFLATMYAFWQPKSPNSIPIPLGSVFWGVTSMTATYQNGVWQPPTYALQEPIIIAPDATYPLWYSVARNSNKCHADN